VFAVAIRGMGKEGAFGAFCAGGDIRFFHQAALAGDPALEDFFTEEYALNHLIHTYPKPYIAFMDGICMGGGMGISQGASLRVVTERSKLAMPETNIGLFPDVGGGYFLSRCAGHVGEYLGLTGRLLQGREALSVGLADGHIEAQRLPKLWDSLGATPFENGEAVQRWVESHLQTTVPAAPWPTAEVNAVFGLGDVKAMAAALDVDAARGAGADPPRARHGPGRRSAHGARPGAPLLPPAPGRRERNRGRGARAGHRQGPRAEVEPGAHRGRDGQRGGGVLRVALAGARAPAAIAGLRSAQAKGAFRAQRPRSR
jgi:enoyl-CoA hydratase/carnithine racemase